MKYYPPSAKPLSLAASLVLALTTSAAPTAVDPAIPEYAPVSGISGNLNSIGSDTLNNLMTFWAEGFKKAYPNVNIQIEGRAPRPRLPR